MGSSGVLLLVDLEGVKWRCLLSIPEGALGLVG